MVHTYPLVFVMSSFVHTFLCADVHAHIMCIYHVHISYIIYHISYIIYHISYIIYHIYIYIIYQYIYIWYILVQDVKGVEATDILHRQRMWRRSTPTTATIGVARREEARWIPWRMAAMAAMVIIQLQLGSPLNVGMSENGVYPQWNSHLVGIMIINTLTIGCRGTLFSDKPMCNSM